MCHGRRRDHSGAKARQDAPGIPAGPRLRRLEKGRAGEWIRRDAMLLDGQSACWRVRSSAGPRTVLRVQSSVPGSSSLCESRVDPSKSSQHRVLRALPESVVAHPESGVAPIETISDGPSGRPTALIVTGTTEEWQALAETEGRRRRATADVLTRLPMLTFCVARGANPGALADLIEAFDVRAHIGPRPASSGLNTAGTEQQVEQWAREFFEGFRRSPATAVVAAHLVRRPLESTWEQLVNESTAYAMFQGTELHRAWLRSRPARPLDTDASKSPVKVTEHHSTVELSLNRPRRHNALNAAMRNELFPILDALRHRPDVEVELRGTGPSFCSGGDLSEFGLTADPVAGHLIRVTASLPFTVDQIGHRLTVGVHGACAGAGIELAAFADRIVASDDAHIWLPEASFGLIPGSGGTVSIPRRIGAHRFNELFVTGKHLDAATAAQWDLVDEVVPRDSLEQRLRHNHRERNGP